MRKGVFKWLLVLSIPLGLMAAPGLAWGQAIILRGAGDAVKVTRGAEELAKALETVRAGRSGRTTLRLLRSQNPRLFETDEVKELMEAARRGELNPRHPIFSRNAGLRALLEETRSPVEIFGKTGCASGECLALTDLGKQIEEAATNAALESATSPATKEAAAIRSAFETPNAWTPFLEKVTTPEEIARVEELARQIARSPEEADQFVEAFYRQARDALAEQSPEVTEFFERVPMDWHRRYGLYYTYPNGLKLGGAADEPATLFDLARAQKLDSDPYILYITPFWKGPGPRGTGVDGGFDIVEYSVAEEYGGEEGLQAVLKATRERDAPVVVDMVANHLSDQTEWMKALRAGDSSMADRFIKVPDEWTKVGEVVEDGRTFALYHDAEGKEVKRWIAFPHDARDHIINVPIGESGEDVRLYHTWYRSQVDVNQRNPDVFEYFLGVQADLVNRGVLGLRIDAAAHVMKTEKLTTDVAGTVAWLELNNRFTKLISKGRARSFPEIGSGTRDAMPYLGETTTLKIGGEVPAVADGFWMFQSRARLPETVISRDNRPFWALMDEIPETVPKNSVFMSMTMHHDELPAEFLMYPERNLPTLLERGVGFRDGAGVSGRTYELMAGNERQLEVMSALQTVGIPNATPVLYYGEEGKLLNDISHAEREALAREKLLREQGTKVTDAFDSRDVHRQRGIDFESVRETSGSYGPSQIYDQLLVLRNQHPSLRSSSRPIRLNSGDDEVIAMIRYTGTGQDTPMLFVTNLGTETKTIKIARRKLEGSVVWAGHQMDSSGAIETALTNARGSNVTYRLTEQHLEITLEGEAFTIAEIPVR